MLSGFSMRGEAGLQAQRERDLHAYKRRRSSYRLQSLHPAVHACAGQAERRSRLRQLRRSGVVLGHRARWKRRAVVHGFLGSRHNASVPIVPKRHLGSAQKQSTSEASIPKASLRGLGGSRYGTINRATAFGRRCSLTEDRQSRRELTLSQTSTLSACSDENRQPETQQGAIRAL